MELKVKAPLLGLAAGEIVTLDDAKGARIVARQGAVWVTEEGGHADHIVGAGDVLVVERQGRTLVQALQAAWISICEGLAAANEADGAGGRQPPLSADDPYEVRRRIYSRYY